MTSLVPFSPSSHDAPVPSLPGPGAGQQRAGDGERGAVCSQLSAHFAAGRLGADELDARLGAAVQAVTLQQLRQLLSDLPAPARPVRTVAPPALVWGALEVVALLVVLGSLGVAAFAVLGLAVMGQPTALAIGFLGGSTAALGGAGLTHLLHHQARRRRLQEQQGQRPRIA
jgi:hypothetical protein